MAGESWKMGVGSRKFEVENFCLRVVTTEIKLKYAGNRLEIGLLAIGLSGLMIIGTRY